MVAVAESFKTVNCGGVACLMVLCSASKGKMLMFELVVATEGVSFVELQLDYRVLQMFKLVIVKELASSVGLGEYRVIRLWYLNFYLFAI